MPLHIRGPAPAHPLPFTPPKRPPTAPDPRGADAVLADLSAAINAQAAARRAAGKAVLS